MNTICYFLSHAFMDTCAKLFETFYKRISLEPQTIQQPKMFVSILVQNTCNINEPQSVKTSLNDEVDKI